ncbi:zinc ABC transporter substrate-binding protein [Sporanaerobium hydrogeniformans]|uniref:Zinc ABC transporter substrate-binding protein n=1 Tax=Sporanaerobium hydrogeniformans TaxID=3072179 RepID=A0AC61DE33_9FIRM|nr:metal ABC transporter substrate-binding protein [Sporanaerobium hydrogeniformans]PHV71416.1 zinc ABC transporter substrate-binding protein [Sporanaerobium hydrogeniformans]
MKKRKNKRWIFLLCLGLVWSLVGCQGKAEPSTKEDKLQLVTSFYPIYIATLNVIKDVPNVELVNMTEPITGCLHDYSLTTKDMKLLEKADAFIINGADMEAFMDKVTTQLQNLTIIEASKGIPLIEEGEEVNPHVWVSISKAIMQVNHIAEGLKELDPLHSALYEANAKAYTEKLEALKQEMHSTLDKIDQKEIVTFHEAFPYFAEEFGLDIIGVVEREPGSQPSVKELADTVEQIKAYGIKALFAEPQYPTKAAETIAKETGAQVYVLDPAVTGPMMEDAYLEIMRNNLAVLKEALE